MEHVMPRSLTDIEPKIVNYILTSTKQKTNVLEIATTNQNKLREFQQLLLNYTIRGVKLDVDEVQSLDPYEVATKKAKLAWEKNGFNPILIEDVSLDLAGLNGRPGALTTFFTSDPQMRREICEEWLKDKDRRATARVIIGIYDGKEAHLFEGVTTGTVPDTPKGSTNFGWDDMFVPDKQARGQMKTYGQMTAKQKNKTSMRKKAIEKFKKHKIDLNNFVLEIPEPFDSELKRVNWDRLTNKKALNFAYQLECLQGNKPNKNFETKTYTPLIEERNPYYLRFKFSQNSPSLGLVLTDVDRVNTRRYKNGRSKVWQVGPERRKLALAQRAEYFLKNTDEKVINKIRKIEDSINDFPVRPNKKSLAVEVLLYGTTPSINAINARGVKELGYKKISSPKLKSRTEISKYGLFNKVGKYPRLVLGVGSMPAVSGWKDVITTSVISHMPVFVTRNNIFAGDEDLRIRLINEAKEDLKKLGFDKDIYNMYTRNIGVAIGTNNPKEELKNAKKMYKKAGVKLFRIYTINGDPRCIETAQLLRKEFGHEIEIFAGQITEESQAEQYVSKTEVDALIIGHGGGRQCTSAINGMAISSVEEIYSLMKNKHFNDTSIVIEGGVGRNVGPLLVLGVDMILFNQQLTRGTVETGGIYLQNHSGAFGQPYHGSASAPTMIIEAYNKKLHEIRINPSGRTKVPEGKPGFTRYSEKTNSMAFFIDEFKHHCARTLADLGVNDIAELREFLLKTDLDLLRIVSWEAAHTASPYGAKSL